MYQIYSPLERRLNDMHIGRLLTRLWALTRGWGLLSTLLRAALYSMNETPPPQAPQHPDLEHRLRMEKELKHLRLQNRRNLLLAALAILVALGSLIWVIGGRHQPTVPVELSIQD